MTCNQYKPSISVFICDIESIKDNQIHEGDHHEVGDLLHSLKETFLIKDNINFHVLNFPFLCSNIPAAPADGVYVSQFGFVERHLAENIYDYLPWIFKYFTGGKVIKLRVCSPTES
jgi:hypothetical protein